MGPSSSISSSDRYPTAPPASVGAGAPSALVGALLLLGVVELAVRAAPAERLIAYETGVQGRFTVREYVRAFGSPEVVFMGSSRAAAGFLMPEAGAVLTDRLGRPVRVANFATGGAQVPELLPLVRFMMRHPPYPRLLVLGMDPEQIGADELFNDRSAIFWSPAEFLAARRRFGSRVDSLLPEVCRGLLADGWATFRYRERPLNLIKELGRGRLPSAVRGEAGIEHTMDPERSLVNHPIDQGEVAHHVRTAHLKPDGTYPFNAARLLQLLDLIDACTAAGVRVVLVELPNAAVFSRYFPADLPQRFEVEMQGAAAVTGARYVTLGELGLEFSDAEFRDPVHLNVNGATRLTHVLSGRILAPPLQPPAP